MDYTNNTPLLAIYTYIMSSHQTIVVELGSSRIKVGFAGESKPRQVLNNDDSKLINNGSGWTVNINDGMVSNACQWSSLFQYLSSPTGVSSSDSFANKITTVHEWEKTLYPLFSHIITSILYIQRPSRHRVLILINDMFPPINFREAIHKVLLEYLNVGAVWLVNGGVYEGLYHLLEGLPPSLPLLGKPKAHLVVDIGTFEARVVVSVAGSSILTDTLQTAAAGYTSFLHQVLANYQETGQEVEIDETGQSEEQKSLVSTLEDANAIVRSWIALSSSSSESLDTTNLSVNLPSLTETQQQQTSTQISAQPLLDAFHQTYLDFSNPSSLIYAMLSCAMICPIDYRKCALQNTLLLGGGSVALQHFETGQRDSAKGLSMQLEMAARDACGDSRDESMSESIEEEKKEDGLSDMSSIARQRFRSLKGVVNGSTIGDDGKRIDGINIQYPDPFAADLATWIGGSIMGTLSYSQHYKKKV